MHSAKTGVEALVDLIRTRVDFFLADIDAFKILHIWTPALGLQKQLTQSSISKQISALLNVISNRLGTERVAGNREVRLRIDQALDRLSPRQRMIFTLRHDLGYTTREIALSVGTTEGSVKKHLFRAVDALKKRLRRLAMENGYEL